MGLDISFGGRDYEKAINIGKSVSSGVQLILKNIALLVQNTAKLPGYVPVLSGNLRSSISTDFNMIQQGVAVVGSPVKYARRREFENKAHPQNLLYLHRAWRDNEGKIKDILRNDLAKELNN